MLTIEMLPAAQGDCLWIEYGAKDDVRRVLIDGGTKGTYKAALRDRVAALPEAQRRFELLVVTHVDSDHIGGALELVRDTKLGVKYGDIWFNGFKHLTKPDELGPAQGDLLTDAIEKQKLTWNAAFGGKAVVVPDEGDLPSFELAGGLKLTLLSPTRTQLAKLRPVWEKVTKRAGMVEGVEAEPDQEELAAQGPSDVLGDDINVPALADTKFKPDGAEANGSSIALLLELDKKKLVLGADAHAPVLIASIQRLLGGKKGKLRVDAVKLPHHGSRNNVSTDLIGLLDSGRYLFSTNGSIYKHPDREAVARVIQYGGERPSLFFNFRSTLNEVWDDAGLKKKYRYDAEYPPKGEAGIQIDVK